MARPNLDRETEKLIERFVPVIRDAFFNALQTIKDQARINAMVEAIEAGNIELAFRVLGISDAALREIMRAVEQAFEDGGIMAAQTFPPVDIGGTRAVFRFDVRNSRAEQWLRNHSSQLITRIVDEQRVAIREIIEQGMVDGRNPRNVALDIVGRIDKATGKRVGGIVGLTLAQERAVRRARKELQDLDASYFNRKRRDARFDRTVQQAIKSGKPLPADVVDKLITRYSDSLLQLRGEMIARSEAIESLNASAHEVHRQLIDTGAVKENQVQRFWDSAGDKRVRNSHRIMDGQQRSLDEPFETPGGARLMFPGDKSLGAPGDETIMCRCRVRTKVDWLAVFDKKPDVEPPTETPAERNRRLDRESKNYTLENGRREGKEFLTAYDSVTGEKIGGVSGTVSQVGFSPQDYVRTLDPMNSFIVHHNHPSSSSFSDQDLITLTEAAGVSGLWAHGHNGSSYYAEPGFEPFTKRVYKKVERAFDNRVQEILTMQNLKDWKRIGNHVIALILHEQGYIRYEYELTAETKESADRHADFIARVVKELSK